VKFINRFGTPFTTGLFVVSVISGVALFFHWELGLFHAMHEWLSITLLVPFALHVWKNWNAILAYARRGTLFIPLIISFIAAVPFAVSGFGTGGGRNPVSKLVPLIARAPLSDLAPILKTTPDVLLTKLQKRGYEVQSSNQTPDSIAKKSGKQASEILSALISTD